MVRAAWELDFRRQAWIQFINSNERTNRKPSRFLSESGGHVSRRTCKPNSVSRRGGTTVIPLGRASLRDSSDLPGSGGASSRNARRISSPLLPYLVLLRVGFALPWLLPARRCALTAPFHPYPGKPGRYVFCGTFRRPGFSRDSQALPGTLLCGVRTFLVHLAMPATVRSSCYCLYYKAFALRALPCRLVLLAADRASNSFWQLTRH